MCFSVSAVVFTESHACFLGSRSAESADGGSLNFMVFSRNLGTSVKRYTHYRLIGLKDRHRLVSNDESPFFDKAVALVSARLEVKMACKGLASTQPSLLNSQQSSSSTDILY